MEVYESIQFALLLVVRRQEYRLQVDIDVETKVQVKDFMRHSADRRH